MYYIIQHCSAFYVVRESSHKFDLHAGNLKKKKNKNKQKYI